MYKGLGFCRVCYSKGHGTLGSIFRETTIGSPYVWQFSEQSSRITNYFEP